MVERASRAWESGGRELKGRREGGCRRGSESWVSVTKLGTLEGKYIYEEIIFLGLSYARFCVPKKKNKKKDT